MSTSTPKNKKRTPEPSGILTTRAALILALSVLIAVASGALTYLNNHSVPGAILAGGATFAMAVTTLTKVIRE